MKKIKNLKKMQEVRHAKIDDSIEKMTGCGQPEEPGTLQIIILPWENEENQEFEENPRVGHAKIDDSIEKMTQYKKGQLVTPHFARENAWF